MDIYEAARERHSVRSYTDKEIDRETAQSLYEIIDRVNADSGMNFQLCVNEPGGFSGVMAKYGSFQGVKNYIVVTGPENMDREAGYYGEKIVLRAQMLGLNTCWVAVTFNRRKAVYTLRPEEKLYLVIALGYGATQGIAHKSKTVGEVSNADEGSPEWFRRGVEAALLAPTAMNQQKFYFAFDGDKAVAEAKNGMYTKMDLGIVQYHFDLGSGRNNFGMKGEI